MLCTIKLIGMKCVLDSRSNHTISDILKDPFSFRLGNDTQMHFLKTLEINSLIFSISGANLTTVAKSGGVCFDMSHLG